MPQKLAAFLLPFPVSKTTWVLSRPWDGAAAAPGPFCVLTWLQGGRVKVQASLLLPLLSSSLCSSHWGFSQAQGSPEGFRFTLFCCFRQAELCKGAHYTVVQLLWG